MVGLLCRDAACCVSTPPSGFERAEDPLAMKNRWYGRAGGLRTDRPVCRPLRVQGVVSFCGLRKLCFRSQAQPALGCLRVKPPVGSNT